MSKIVTLKEIYDEAVEALRLMFSQWMPPNKDNMVTIDRQLKTEVDT